MSQIDTEDILSETKAGHGDDGRETIDDGREMLDNSKFVPVAESKRYRKRAQSAEKKAEVLSEQLAHAKSQVTNLSGQLKDIQTEQKLMNKLSAAGTVDTETAVLIAKARVNGCDDADLDGIVEQLKKEKQYLFADNGSTMKIPKTAGPRQRTSNSQTALERAAKKAATTGNRTDLQEYLRLRRNFV